MENKSGYLAWHADAERRYKAGERQRQCGACRLWLWTHERCDCAIQFYADGTRLFMLIGKEPGSVKRFLAECADRASADYITAALNAYDLKRG